MKEFQRVQQATVCVLTDTQMWISKAYTKDLLFLIGKSKSRSYKLSKSPRYHKGLDGTSVVSCIQTYAFPDFTSTNTSVWTSKSKATQIEWETLDKVQQTICFQACYNLLTGTSEETAGPGWGSSWTNGEATLRQLWALGWAKPKKESRQQHGQNEGGAAQPMDNGEEQLGQWRRAARERLGIPWSICIFH